MATKGSYRAAQAPVCVIQSMHLRTIRKKRTIRYRHVQTTMLIFIIGGSGTALIDRRKVELVAGTVLLLTPGMQITVSCPAKNLDYYLIAFTHLVADAVGRSAARVQFRNEPLGLFEPGVLQISRVQQAMKLVQRLYEDSQSGLDDGRMMLRFQELLLMMAQDCDLQQARDGSRHCLDQSIAYMKAHFHEKLDMRELAAIAGVTLSSYSRLFKQITGETPTEYLTRLRMENAQQLLKQNQYKVKEVSSAVGYKDEFYFSHAFHRFVGITPTQYRKRSQLRVAVASCTQLEDCLVSLGIQPVTCVNCFRYPGMADEEYEHLFTRLLEELVQARPDVIIGDRHHLSLEDRFKAITRQIVYAVDMDWVANYRKLAELFGTMDGMNTRMNELSLRTNEAKGILKQNWNNQSVAIIQVSHLGIRVQGMTGHPLNELIYRELELPPGKNIPMQLAFMEYLPEWLPQLEADHLFIHMNHRRAGSEAIYERMRQTHAWQSINAVQRGTVTIIPNWFRLSWTPAGRDRIMLELLEAADS
ncbi:helix-turn-helix domain-containing protein [Paenibacillus oenotherae]|uniref:Helix-turn-helix domain-containing protein n=1 Tax=Paenibacillus oenotherae TaxID=1435645 RepID=A0ABS7DCE1_9BACL|nr:helix-turn-helix domain-containing protein [Paenibacillus oenotherae]MBW7477550.1 helix-turn-helix domain-containing protein [Paenibacillus oenotherae]